MRYFIPEWDDRIDPSYNFLTEEHSKSHESNAFSDYYMWEIFPQDKIPFDGVLVSRAKLEQNKKKLEEITKSGIRSLLRLPEKLPLLADCGAWSYIGKDVPPYDPVEILNFYSSIGVDKAVTVDHLVVPKFQDKKEQRLRVTFENGVKGFEAWKRKYKETFVLYASVQGWDVDDYVRMIEDYNKHGIETFALGGLARSPTKEVMTLVDRIESELKTRRIRISGLHFFGLGRFPLLRRYAELEERGVDVSFDTASWLRRAWLSGVNYYFMKDEKLTGYSAIRIPQTGKKRTGLRGEKKLSEDTDFASVGRLEKQCLSSIREYGARQADLQTAIRSIMKYGEAVPTVRPEMKGDYERTLRDKPWETCGCEICRTAGVEVLIFRGNNRNRRRGFHNVYTIYHKVITRPDLWPSLSEEPTQLDLKQLTELNGKVLVVVECTKKKLGYAKSTKTKAKNLYQGQIFKVARTYSESRKFDYVIISAKYGLLFPDDVIEGYDKVLRTREDVEAIREQVEERLSKILPNYDTVLVIGGKLYRAALRNLWNGRFVTLKSRGYGDMTHMLAEATVKNVTPLSQFMP